MLVKLISAVAESYRSVPKLIAAAPLLVLAPIAAEALQHAIEWWIGMFSGFPLAPSVAGDWRRSGAGLLKVSTLAIVGILAARSWAHGEDLSRAVRLDARERRFFVGGIVITAAALSILVFTPAFLSDIALSPKQRRLVPAVLLVAAAALFQRHSVWAVAGLLGDRSMTKERAAALSAGRPARFTMLALVVTIAPPMALHYALNFTARGLGSGLLTVALAVDSLLVGAMAILIGNIIWISYRDAQAVGAAGGDPR
jgi:hypothetical protein